MRYLSSVERLGARWEVSNDQHTWLSGPNFYANEERQIEIVARYYRLSISAWEGGGSRATVIAHALP